MKTSQERIKTQDPRGAALDAFLKADSTQNLSAFIEKLQPYYCYEDDIYNDLALKSYVSQTLMSPLEIVAESGSIPHLNALLNQNYAIEEPLNAIPMDIINAFYRALENGHSSVLLRLLQYPKMTDVITKVSLQTNIQTSMMALYAQSLNDLIPEPERNPYLNKIRRPDHYPLRYNKDVGCEGNVALILAAGLPTADIFNYMLKTFPSIHQQLASSSLVAFLSATRHPDGTPKTFINTAIVYQLLAVPGVYDYALSREYDFGDLILGYNREKAQTPTPQEPPRGFRSKFFEKISSNATINTLDSSGSIPLSSSSALALTDQESSAAAISDSEGPFSRCASVSPYCLG
jgi:hypothetical protein